MTWGPRRGCTVRGECSSLPLSRPARGAEEHGASGQPILSMLRRRGPTGAGRGSVCPEPVQRVGPRIAFQAINNTRRQIFCTPPLNRMLHLAW